MSEHTSNPAVAFRVILGVVAVWVVADLIWWATGEPEPKVDYAAKLTAMVTNAQPEGRDGWPICIEAARYARGIDEQITREYRGTLAFDDQWGYRPDYDRIYGETPRPDDLSWEFEAIERIAQRGVFDMLADAATCPRMVRPISDDVDLYSQLMPELASFRNLAKVRVATMKLATEAGRYDETVAAFEQTLTLARASGNQIFVIERLVAMAIASLALSEIRQEILETDFDAATIRALREAMDRQLDWPHTVQAIEGERAMMLDFVQRSYTDDGHGGGRLDPQVASDLWSGGQGGPLATFGGSGAFQAGRTEAIAVINEMCDGFARNAKLTPAARLTRGFNVNMFQGGLTARHIAVMNMVPSLDRFIESEDNFWMRVEGTRLMLALAEHRARHGGWPRDLDELVPAILPAMPIDPSCGRPYVYRRAGDGSGRLPFLLYSRGMNGVDDSTDAIPDVPETTGAFGVSVQTGDVLLSVPRRRRQE